MTESVATCYTHLVINKQVMAALASTEGGQAATQLEWCRLPFMFSLGNPWYELPKVTLNPYRASARAQGFRFSVEFDITGRVCLKRKCRTKEETWHPAGYSRVTVHSLRSAQRLAVAPRWVLSSGHDR